MQENDPFGQNDEDDEADDEADEKSFLKALLAERALKKFFSSHNLFQFSITFEVDKNFSRVCPVQLPLRLKRCKLYSNNRND